ncbi:MAG: PAS domain S-box protein [Pirellulales bacterium]|nr:PAS domain S-box protein [Pirellulales bacterium]
MTTSGSTATGRSASADDALASYAAHRLLIDGLPAAIYACDADGCITLFNEAAVKLWGVRPEAGRTRWCGSHRIFDADGRALPLDACPLAVALREKRPVEPTEILVERPDGSRRHVLAHPRLVFDADGAVVGAQNMLVDVTEQKQTQSALAAAKDDLAAQVDSLTQLHDLAMALAGPLNLPEALQAVTQTLVRLHRADAGRLALYDADRGCLQTVASEGFSPRKLELISHAEGGACGAAFATKKRCIVTDVQTDPRMNAFRPVAREVGVRAIHSTPVLTRSGDILGVISVYFAAPRDAARREKQLANLCARHAADAIEADRHRQALSDSQQRFSMFMRHLPGLAWIKDSDGRVVFVNDAAERALGRPKSELYGRQDLELFPSHTAPQLADDSRRALSAGSPVETIETLTQDDGVHHALVSKFPVPDASGATSLFGGIAIDVTERVQAEQALRNSEERFRAVTMNAPVAIFIKDVEGRYTLCNPLASQALGLPHGAVGRTDYDVMSRELADKLRARDLEVLSSGQIVENEDVIPLRGVDRYYLSVKFPLRNSQGAAVGVAGVAVDITDRKAAQQALRESERRLLLATQAGKVGVWAWDIECKRVSWSESLQTILGVDPANLVEHEGFESLVHPEDRLRVRHAIWSAAESGVPMEIEFRAIRPDGGQSWLFSSATVICERGRAVRMLGATLDITERKQGEIALRESEARFRTLASHAPVGIFQTDRSGRTIFINESWSRMAGLSAEQAQGDGWQRAIHPDDRDRVLTGWQKAVAKAAPSDEEFRFQRPDGVVTWLQGHAVPLLDEQGELMGYIGTVADITARKEAESALRNSERMYRAIGESIDYGIWVCDAEGRNIYASESFLGLLGITQEQCSNHGWADLLHPDDVDQTLAAWKQCVKAGGTWDVEHRFRGRDGKWRPVLARGVPVSNEQGEIIAWVGINLDISELKEVENELRESEARFRNMADNAPVLIWVHGVGGCQYVNKEYLRFVGGTLADVQGMNWAEYIHPDDAQGYVDSYMEAFERRQPIVAQFRFRRADGEYRWLTATGAPRFRPDGAFLGYVGCSVDVTDIKSSEAALLEADRRKDDFLAMLGHELRNPLAGIVTGAQVLSMLRLEPEAAEMQAVISRQASYMSRIVDDLLDVSRIARGKLRLRRQYANLRHLLRDTVDDYRKSRALDQCELYVNIPDVDLWVWADPARLAQAFSNIIHNSYKFSDGPNVIAVELSADQDMSQAVIVINDRGIGMAKETLERLFEPFSQADTTLERSRGGLGLGLALTKGLLQLHGGDVTAYSAGLGQGAAFTITLPCVKPPLRSGDSAAPESAASQRVLIIDDRRDAILPLQKMLQMDGHTVASALDGPAGLEKAADFQPHVVLCDIGLPGDMNGYQVSRALRDLSQTAGSYLVAVTGYGHEEARRKAKEAGFDYHVTKPLNKQQLRDLLAHRPTF